VKVGEERGSGEARTSGKWGEESASPRSVGAETHDRGVSAGHDAPPAHARTPPTPPSPSSSALPGYLIIFRLSLWGFEFLLSHSGALAEISGVLRHSYYSRDDFLLF
jgi:hypothetical protein